MREHHRRFAVLAAALTLGATLTACGDDDAGDGNSITVWSLENLDARINATRDIIARFTEETGIEVELVGVAEDQFNQLITPAAGSGDLPDVVGALPLAGVWSMSANDLVDADANEEVTDQLGTTSFSERALELTRDGDAQIGVPSDGWAQLLIYRKDLFDQAGLEPPTTYDAILTAAQTLDGDGMAGITAATVPDDPFTEQTFEHVALANGCQMVNDDGEVSLDSDNCVGAFDFYGELISQYSVEGAQGVESTRATYFAGQAAMVVWSSFILDEMAGLRDDALPSCPQCAEDPAFLARNSGIVTALSGPDGEEAQFGELTSWTIADGANTDAATQFVEFMMSEGYEDWLGLAPEGKFPARQGTADEPDRYLNAWEDLPAGVDRKQPLSEAYPPEVLDALRQSPDNFARWGFEQGAGDLVGASLGELPVPQAVNSLVNGGIDAEQAATQADEDVTEIQESLN